jgi:hypothetical protein
MEYEAPVASGRLRLELNDRPTGRVESWRLTLAFDGYHILRIQVENADESGQDLLLFHVLFDRNMMFERAKFRCFRSDLEIDGDLQVTHNALSSTRLLIQRKSGRRERFEEEVVLDPERLVLIPTVSGLSFMLPEDDSNQELSYYTIDKESAYKLSSGSASLNWGQEESLVVLQQSVAVRPCLITFPDGETTLWVDRRRLPLRFERNDGLSAHETAYWRYEPATKPAQRQ